MSRFDRYLLSQLMALFGFFSLVLVAVYWVNRAVGLFDQLIGDGQSALVFLEFTALTLPNVIRIVLPVSAFAAAVYVANRLTQDSELVVMQATGFSPWRLARPVVLFGLIVTAMMVLLMNWIVPASRTTLAARTAEIQANVSSRFLREGAFMHPTDGVTFYIRQIAPSGELIEVFLSDARDPKQRIAYSAQKALVVRSDDGPKLVMFDGMAQALERETGRLIVTRFADVTYDLAPFLAGADALGPTPDEAATWDLLRADDALAERLRSSRAGLLQEAHNRLASPFLGLVGPLIGFATLLLGAFSRFGLWRQVLGAILLLVAVQLVDNVATGLALRDAAAWPAVYLAPAFGGLVAVILLWLAGRPRRVPSGQAVPA